MSCNNNSCGCERDSIATKISTTTSNCGCSTSCDPCDPCSPPPVVCLPPGNPTAPTVTIGDLLKLIDTKCSKEICAYLQVEIDLLYLLLGLEDQKPVVPGQPLPPGTNPPGTVPPEHHKKFQLVVNMVNDLKGGKLKDKYPSAELLKKELLALWKCMADKQQHHGDWVNNFTYRDIQHLTDELCLLDGGKDPAPGKIKVITPVDVGSTVFHTITNDKGVTKKCLFESLVDNNIVEPSMASVLDGKWMNYCDIKDVIDCILPRVKITDCKQACDDPNHDGVHEGKPLCDCVICDVIDTNTVDLTKTKLPVTKDNPFGRGNSIKGDVRHQNTPSVKLTDNANGLKADVIISPDAGNGASIKPNGVFTDHVTKYELIKPAHGPSEYKITMGSGKTFVAPCCSNAIVADTDASDTAIFPAVNDTIDDGQIKSFYRPGFLVVPEDGIYICSFGQQAFYIKDMIGCSSTFGYQLSKNGVRFGNGYWTNDHDDSGGGTTDHVGAGTQILHLHAGDKLGFYVRMWFRGSAATPPVTSLAFNLDGSHDKSPPAAAEIGSKAYMNLVKIGELP